MNPQMKFQTLKQTNAFGGELLKKAKNRHARPMSSRDPVHLVLRSTKAKGVQSFGHAKNLKRVRETIEVHCERYGVKLIKWSNNFNHLHLLAKFPSREIYRRFIRSLTSALAMLVTGARKTKRLTERFWDFRPFTRIVRGLRAFKIAYDYIRLNEMEAAGEIPHRDGRLRELKDHERRWFNSEW